MRMTPLVEKYKIRAVPTLIKEDNGVEIDRHVGIMTEEEARRADEDAALGCAILGFIIIVTIVGCIIL